jgi:putative membrane protein
MSPIIPIAVITGCSFVIVSFSTEGPLARHMALHILLMNAAAPIASLPFASLAPQRLKGSGWLAFATFVQVAALWVWHAPPILGAALRSTSVLFAMHASLVAAALLFWTLIFAQQGNTRWRSILALLITSKLYCLLGVLLVFAPALLYPNENPGYLHAHSGSISDQQLAGLLMIAACPLVYVSTGIIMAARWLRGLADNPDLATVSSASPHRQSC